MRRFVLTCLCLIGSASTGRPQAVFADADAVLAFIPAAEAECLAQRFPSGLRFYHRLPDGYLAGVSAPVLPLLQKSVPAVAVIDERGWSARYAAVTGMGLLEAMPASMVCNVEVLRRWDDLQLIRGGDDCMEQLRKQGFSVVEIERAQVPVAGAVTTRWSAVPPALLTGIDTILTRVSVTQMTATIQGLQNFGTRLWNNTNRDSVSRWLLQKYQQAGIADVRLDSFQHNGTWQMNVVATIPGLPGETGEIVVGGHLDSYSSNPAQAPGADDNASGAVAALEMARALKSVRYRPALTLRFIGFAAEEAGLRGSASYAQRARAAGRDIRAMLNYDMIANRSQLQTDWDVYIVWYSGAEALRELHAAMMRAYTPLTPVITTSYRSGSDSYSFWQQSYPAVFCIERDFSPYYHSPSDLIQYLDLPYAAEIVKSGLATVLVLDATPPSVAGLEVRDWGDGSSVLVSWDSVNLADFSRYRIALGTSPGVYSVTVEQTGRSRILTGLTAGLQYYVGVSVIDLAGRQGMVTERGVVPGLVPLAPVGATAQHLGTSIRLLWRRNREVDLLGYNAYRASPELSFIRMNQQPISDTAWTDAAIEGVYYITAVDSSLHEGEPSDTVRVLSPRFYGVLRGWNIVSVPLSVPDHTRTTLFPDALSDAIGYDGGYTAHLTLDQGRGYWLKFPAAQQIALSGVPVVRDTVAIAEGWNMVGSVSDPVNVATVETQPSGILASRFYGYSGQGYVSAGILLPGAGYWVKASQAGMLILSAAPGTNPARTRAR